ncbi:MAG: hypothetical protein NVS1B7_0320 [Candidatus Saccharimonadales bacterium]
MKLTSKVIIGFIGCIIAATTAMLTIPRSFMNSTVAPVMFDQQASKTLSINGAQFRYQLADTPVLRERGLSNTIRLPNNAAMLFVFNPSETTCFWMKDMQYNLDILWFDEQQKLIYQKLNVSPSTYPSVFCAPASAKYVVEINGSIGSKLHTSVGNVLQFSH